VGIFPLLTFYRSNLLAVIVFTAINLILTAFNANISFLFSATLPQVVFEIGKTLDSETGSSIFIIIGLIIAFIIIILYFVFWILAKRVRVFILVALIFFGIDSLALLFLVLNTKFNASFLLEIAFHAWILYYLINGVKAWTKTRGIHTDVFNDILQGLKSNNIGSSELAVSDEPKKEITQSNNSSNEFE
jgi:hypothetical protein